MSTRFERPSERLTRMLADVYAGRSGSRQIEVLQVIEDVRSLERMAATMDEMQFWGRKIEPSIMVTVSGCGLDLRIPVQDRQRLSAELRRLSEMFDGRQED